MTTAVATEGSEYVMLKGMIPKRMFETQDRHFYVRLARTLGVLGATIVALFWAKNSLSPLMATATTLLLSANFGVFMTQGSLCAHEVGHKSAIRNPKKNRKMSLFIGPLLLGVSYTWWNGKHNQHHAAPNREGVDTDIDFPILVFDARQASSKRKIVQPILRNQHLLILPLLSLQAINTQIGTVRYLLSRPENYKSQLVGVTLHWAAMLFLAYQLGTLYGVLFLVTALAAHGCCNSSVFAPNHKGMDLIDRYAPLNRFRDQVVPSRNVHGNNPLTQRLTKFWYGGLEYQIEHHLFPTMPMDNLEKIAPIVREYCNQVGVDYASVTAGKSYIDIYRHQRRVAIEVRKLHRMERVYQS